jgi:transposase
MENELENMTKQELIKQLLQLKKSNQKLESSNQKLESSNQHKDLIIVNLQRMLFGSKKERFISENKEQLAFLFEEFASQEALDDETPVKEKITYEREKPSKHAGRNKLPETLPVIEEIIEPEEVTEDMVKIGEEITEILEYTPAQFFKRVIIRPKYVNKNDTRNQNCSASIQTHRKVLGRKLCFDTYFGK